MKLFFLSTAMLHGAVVIAHATAPLKVTLQSSGNAMVGNIEK